MTNETYIDKLFEGRIIEKVLQEFHVLLSGLHGICQIVEIIAHILVSRGYYQINRGHKLIRKKSRAKEKQDQMILAAWHL